MCDVIVILIRQTSNDAPLRRNNFCGGFRRQPELQEVFRNGKSLPVTISLAMVTPNLVSNFELPTSVSQFRVRGSALVFPSFGIELPRPRRSTVSRVCRRRTSGTTEAPLILEVLVQMAVESVQFLLVELKLQSGTQIPVFSSYPEIYCLVDEVLRLLHESGHRVALRVHVVIRLRTREDKCAFRQTRLRRCCQFHEKRVFRWEIVLRGNSCCLRLKKSFPFPSMTSSCLFKRSFLVMKYFKTLLTTCFTNFS